MNGVAISLMDSKQNKNFNRNQLEYAMKNGDRDLFVKFRDGVITYDQLRARGAEKNGYAKYVVLDDFIHKLNPVLVAGLEDYKKTYQMRFGKES